jgi:hypothetical protein
LTRLAAGFAIGLPTAAVALAWLWLGGNLAAAVSHTPPAISWA